MKCINLIAAFGREIEVLEMTDDWMIYAIDRKTEMTDVCAIERMTFADEVVTILVTLEYTRLYESFRTYGQLRDFFYVVNVLQDYCLRLRKINKQTWEIEEDILVNPEGEILNIYPLDERYMLIVDEIAADHPLANIYGAKPSGQAFINVRYLYEVNSAKRYPIKERRFDSLTEDLPICLADGKPILIYEAFYHPETKERYSESAVSEILMIYCDEFIEAVINDQEIPFRVLACGDKHSFVRLNKVEDSSIIFKKRYFEKRQEELYCYNFKTSQATLLTTYAIPGDGSLYYDLWKMHVYYCEEADEDGEREVLCLNIPEDSFAYDSRYGTFSRKDGQQLVTAYYVEVLVKDEYEFHEYLAIHDLVTGEVSKVSGRVAYGPDTAIFLRSFLIL